MKRAYEPADRTRADSERVVPDGMRETLESIVFAFILAFLFRTFEAEAFVIPTGSMAPTLMGRHKDLECPRCGYPFRVNASEEIDSETGRRLVGNDVVACTCPNCRYTIDMAPENGHPSEYYSYNGDRILACKFSYDFNEPRRWDVVLFKCPVEAKTNFIKRMVGLPNETVRIMGGDVYARSDGAPDFVIQSKPPEKIWAMRQPVHDNDYLADALEEAGWPRRWTAWPPEQPAARGAWAAGPMGHWFVTDGSAADDVWIRYRHVVPSYEDWSQILAGTWDASADPPSQLISDMYAYNTNQDALATDRLESRHAAPPRDDTLGWHWVGDLLVECQVEVHSEAGQLILELVEGERRFAATIDVATGTAVLSIDGVAAFQPTARTHIRGPGTYELTFSNFDNELVLWVDGAPVAFDTSTAYPSLGNRVPGLADLAPVGIGSRGAALTANHLRVYRDVYYVAAGHATQTDFEGAAGIPRLLNPTELHSTPSEWGVFEHMRQIVFHMNEDEFLMLGDNSPRSRDSRLWGRPGAGEHAVHRSLLLGKALVVYWPHAWETAAHATIPGTELRVPFYPNLSRMSRVC